MNENPLEPDIFDDEPLEPEGTLDHSMVLDALSLVGAHIARQSGDLTQEEMGEAYDWAMREHFHASDNAVKRRSKPVFIHYNS